MNRRPKSRRQAAATAQPDGSVLESNEKTCYAKEDVFHEHLRISKLV